MFLEKCSWVIVSRRFGYDPFISGLIFGLQKKNVEVKRAYGDENATYKFKSQCARRNLKSFTRA